MVDDGGACLRHSVEIFYGGADDTNLLVVYHIPPHHYGGMYAHNRAGEYKQKEKFLSDAHVLLPAAVSLRSNVPVGPRLVQILAAKNSEACRFKCISMPHLEKTPPLFDGPLVIYAAVSGMSVIGCLLLFCPERKEIHKK